MAVLTMFQTHSEPRDEFCWQSAEEPRYLDTII